MTPLTKDHEDGVLTGIDAPVFGLSRWRTRQPADHGAPTGWSDMVSRLYGACVFDHPLTSDYDAAVDVRRVDRLRVLNVVCDPTEGRQIEPPPALSASTSFSIQLIGSGEKMFRSEGVPVVARQGDVLINFGCTRNTFQVRERSRETTLTLPVARLKTWLPGAVQKTRLRMAAELPAAQMLTASLQAIATGFLSGRFNNTAALIESVTALLAATLDAGPDHANPKQLKLWEIRTYIDDHLEEPDLSPRDIAAAKNISVRYLHELFEAQSQTVQQYVIRQRLLRCQRDLANPGLRGRTVTEIAYGCGFQNSTHFSRRFKEAFGVSPSRFRTMAIDRA